MVYHRTSHFIRFTTLILFAFIICLVSPLSTDHVQAQTATPTRTPTPINLGNFVWDDLDEDGAQDAGEPGMAGVNVQLWNSAKTLMIDSTLTNANGNFTVVAPVPGNYRIRVVLPAVGDQFSPKDAAGGDNTKDSDINPSGTDAGFTDIFNIASNVISISNLDAGIIRYVPPTPTRTPTPINLGNFVWDDLNSDGAQDPGEPGIECVTVQLWNGSKTQLIDSDVTNANGNYTVVAPEPGNYRIRVVLPTVDDVFSPMDAAGGDNTKDSDINPLGIDAGFTDIFNIASNVISITSMDAGIIRSATPIVCAPTATPTATATATATATPTATATATLGPVPQLIAPAGTLTNTIGNPLFTWVDTGAPSYQLLVGGADSGISNGTIYLFDEHIPRQGICNGGVCDVLLPDLNPAAWLPNGEFLVFVNTNTGEWQGPYLFTIAATVPDAPMMGEATNTQNPQPTLNWTLAGNAAHAAFFHLYIAPADDLASPVVDTWQPRDTLCGTWDGTVCSWTLNVNLQTGKAYHVYMQSWGAGGFSTGGVNNSGWSMGIFNVGGPTPAIPDANNFVYNVNAGEVAITFPDDGNTTSVYFFIGDVSATPLVANFLQEMNDGQMGCNGLTCSFTPTLAVPLTTGTYTVYVQPQSSGGPRGDGILNLGWFAAGTFNVP